MQRPSSLSNSRTFSQLRAPGTTGSIRSGPIELPKPPASFRVVKEFEFFQAESNTFRADITVVENTPYVAISSWWFNRQSACWLPTRKQIFLPKAAWFGLVQHAPEISEEIGQIGDAGELTGMSWLKGPL